MPRLSDWLDFADQQSSAPVEIHSDDDINAGIWWRKFYLVDVDNWHTLQQRMDRICSLALNVVHVRRRFQHVLKMAEKVKCVKLFQ